MTWFTALTGFEETSVETVRSNLVVEGSRLVSRVNGRRMRFGEFTIPSLADLKADLNPSVNRPLRIRQLVANVESLHQDPENRNAVFQVASQFNCLEMAAPHLTPEDGVGIYQNDRTQGPACAISAGAGTIYRNYFVPIGGQSGQSAKSQIDCLSDIGKLLGNESNRLWSMRNGYCFPTDSGIEWISEHLRQLDSVALAKIRGKLRIGHQFNTEVTVGDSNHVVTQTFCSALPVAYSPIPQDRWAPFASLVLDAAYEATFSAAVSNFSKTGTNKLFLTLLGGGAFGNKMEWILSAILRSARLFSDSGLNVAIVSHGRKNSEIEAMLSTIGPDAGNAIE